jgi:hypothetical protein
VDAKKWATIKVRLRASGVDPGDRWQLNAFRPALTPAHGAPLELDWQEGQEVFEAPGASGQLNYVVVDFLIPRSDYDRLKSSTLTLHLDFALTQATPARSWRFPLPEGNFTIPDLASCSSREIRPRSTLEITGLICRYPLRMPVMSLTTFPSKGPCAAAPVTAGDPAAGNSSTGGDFNTAPASFGISPMEDGLSLSFGTYNSVSGTPTVESQLPRVCLGTPLVVTQYRKVRAVQTGVTIENFRFGD